MSNIYHSFTKNVFVCKILNAFTASLSNATNKTDTKEKAAFKVRNLTGWDNI